MNAHGISVFYGADEINTCINEIRPPVGSRVVIGRFAVLTDLKLLNFEALSQVEINKSLFDPACAKEKMQAAFFENFISEISRPILPADEESNYIPTQIVAEYLAEKFEPKIDGIIFHSAQSGVGKRNIVLFNHASKVEDYEFPKGASVEVTFGYCAEDEHDTEITIWERIPSEPPVEKKETGMLGFPRANTDIDVRRPSLRLDVKNLIVYPIIGAKYEYPTGCYVSRYQDTVNSDI